LAPQLDFIGMTESTSPRHYRVPLEVSRYPDGRFGAEAHSSRNC